MLEKKTLLNFWLKFFFHKIKKFLKMVDLFAKMCRINFQEIFIIIDGVPDLSKKSYLSNTALFNPKTKFHHYFPISGTTSIFATEKVIRDTSQNGHVTVHFNQLKPFKDMALSKEATRILNTPNAGGSSLESEVLSFEVLKKFFGAKLLMTEMEVCKNR